jgi:Mn2+/Fe2+ NRAMP family transporter
VRFHERSVTRSGPGSQTPDPQGLKNPDVWVHLAFLVRLGHFFDISPIKALYWTAILNGLLAPFLLVGILIIACDRTIMQKQPSSMISRIVVGVTALLMFGAAIGMFVF